MVLVHRTWTCHCCLEVRECNHPKVASVLWCRKTSPFRRCLIWAKFPPQYPGSLMTRSRMAWSETWVIMLLTTCPTIDRTSPPNFECEARGGCMDNRESSKGNHSSRRPSSSSWLDPSWHTRTSFTTCVKAELRYHGFIWLAELSLGVKRWKLQGSRT